LACSARPEGARDAGGEAGLDDAHVPQREDAERGRAHDEHDGAVLVDQRGAKRDVEQELDGDAQRPAEGHCGQERAGEVQLARQTLRRTGVGAQQRKDREDAPAHEEAVVFLQARAAVVEAQAVVVAAGRHRPADLGEPHGPDEEGDGGGGVLAEAAQRILLSHFEIFKFFLLLFY